MVKKKIIFLIPTLNVGGGERAVSELSSNLPNHIEIIIVLFKNQVFYPYKGKLFCLNIPLSNSLFFKIYYFFIGVLRLKKIINKEKPDNVISFGVPAGVMNILTNKKTLLRVDGTASMSHGFLYQFLIKVFYNKSNEVICVSKRSAKDLVDNFGIKKEKIRVIYNPLNIKEIQNLTKEPLDAEYEEIFKNPVIISVGRLSKEKNHGNLIRVFKEVKIKINSAKLVILGSGEMESYLRQLIKDSKIENSVYLLGWQKNPFKFLAKSKVFVLSSFSEGLPYALLEAMACGLPIISADCKSGPREILAPKTDINYETKHIEYGEFGILTPAFDGKKREAAESLTKSEEFLAQAMIKLLTDKKLAVQLSQKSKRRANDFDIKNIIKNWEFLNN